MSTHSTSNTLSAPEEPQRFLSADLDNYARRVTTGLAYLGGIMMLPLLFAYLSGTRWDGLLIPTALALPIALFLCLCYAFQPTNYIIDKDELVIERRWWRPLRSKLNDLGPVAPATGLADLPRHGLRFAFNAGIFGYQGPFRLAPYGEAFFVATNRERLVSIGRGGRPPLVVSPQRPRAFIDALNQQQADRALAQLATPAEEE